MKIGGIDHVVLLVSNLARMTEFYSTVLGCRVKHRQDDIGLVHLQAGNALIDLVDRAGTLGVQSPGAAGPGRNLDHICLRVEAFNAETVRAELAAHGVESDPPAERYGFDGHAQTIYLRDVEGNGIELRG
ncbi:VOC family protein [Novosphingobium lentum]|uniref:VOC family protein n=1 Tax=Novosphingobium lentum TaxID=145287 RepID=UPI00083116D0|nr:VOC family protein [Novosphingobium lentum]